MIHTNVRQYPHDTKYMRAGTYLYHLVTHQVWCNDRYSYFTACGKNTSYDEYALKEQPERYCKKCQKLEHKYIKL
jgi:hypothetical protein